MERLKKLFLTSISSLIFRNILTFVVILFLVAVPLVVTHLQDVEDLVSDTIKVQLSSVAELAGLMLNVEEVAQIQNMIWYDTPEYNAMIETLGTLQRNFGVDNAVLYRRQPDNKFVYIGDGHKSFGIGTNVNLHEVFPETYAPANEAWETGRPGNTSLFESGQSSWFQINSPLMVGDEVVAVLLLNKFSTPVAVAIGERQKVILLELGVALALGVAVWWGLTAFSLKPLLRLQKAATEIAAGNLDVEIPHTSSKSEIGQLNYHVIMMVAEMRAQREQIEEQNRTLEERIEARTREIRSLLDNMDEGILSMDADGAIQPGFSAAVPDMLGEVNEGRNFFDFLTDDDEVRKTARETFSILLYGDIDLPWEDMVENMPSEMQPREGLFLKARYSPVPDPSGEGIERIMVVLQDVTKEKALEENLAANSILHEMVVKIIQNRETFEEFYRDGVAMLAQAEATVAGMESVNRADVDEIFRALHTIKGTSGLFGLTEATEFAHEVEDALRDLNTRRDEAYPEEERMALSGNLGALIKMLEQSRNTFMELVGEEDSEATHTLTERKLEKVEQRILALTAQDKSQEMQQVLARMRWIPAGRLLRKYKTLVESVAERLGKQVRFSLVGGEETEIPMECFKRLDPTFLHIIRNALDHGVDTWEERMEAEKDPTATIELSARYGGDGLVFTIRDDGRGIDLERIKAIGLERGFIKPEGADAMEREDILRLLFLPAFSSKETVSDLSGRGVGLDVVRTDVEAMGGRMRLETRKGQGSSFHLYYPLNV